MKQKYLKLTSFCFLTLLIVIFQNCSPSEDHRQPLILREPAFEDLKIEAYQEAYPEPSATDFDALAKEPPATKPFANGKFPEAPTLLHQVHEVDVTRNTDGSVLRTTPQYYQTMRPAIPPVRTSHDGRLGFNWSNGMLYLLAPEKIDRAFPLSERGLNILTDLDGWFSHWPYFLSKPSDPVDAGFAGGTICNHVNKADQPKKCGLHDCYEVTYMGFRTFTSIANSNKTRDQAYFRSRKMIIEIQNPKTPTARILDIRPAPNSELKEKDKPIEIDYNLSPSDFLAFEPVATSDGRLFVTRVNFVAIKGIDGGNDSGNNNVDISYMVAPLSAPPCDASQFTDLKRIQKAPFDPEMKDPSNGKTRYGIAEYPMRDSFGNLIPQDAMFPTYPWIDREGNNLFFASGGGVLFSFDWKFNKVPTVEPERNEQQQEMLANSARYPIRCIEGVPNCAESPYNPESPEHIRGVSVLGSWTRGKTIVLDGMINHTDYGLKRGLQFQRDIQLYEARADFDGWVRVGGGRDSGPSGSGLENQLESYSENSEIRGMSQTSNVIDSLENIFNTYRNMRPTLPRDVVWTINNASGSDEVVFDDFIDPRALIISSMIPGAEFINVPRARYDSWYFRDGFDGENDSKKDQQSRAILIQNAATNHDLPLPAFGYLNRGRVEPVALGGIHGRGLWLDGNNNLSYQFPRELTNVELFLTIFLDNRAPQRNFRQILSFPDNTKLLFNGKILRLKKGDYILDSAINSQQSGWFQLGLGVAKDGRAVSVYTNGMKLTTLTSKKPIFQITNPDKKAKLVLRIGKQNPDDTTPGFRGWIDELKLLTYIPTAEVVCNHAYGSLHWLREDATQPWQNRAALYSALVHQEIYNSLPSSFTAEQRIPAGAQFVCTSDYTDANSIYRSRMRESEGLVSIRDTLLFANPKDSEGFVDGRLQWNSPRPDFRANSFCLSCHGESERRGLAMAALTPGDRCAMMDRRRQPLQSPLFLTGQITEDQLRSIDPFHQQRNKFYDTTTGALLTDPFLLMNLDGASPCGGFTPKSTMPVDDSGSSLVVPVPDFDFGKSHSSTTR